MNTFKRFAVAAVLLSSVLAFSAGFSLLEQSTIGMGRSLAGMTAETDEPSALFFNPSAIGFMDHAAVTGGLHILTGDVRIKDRGSSASLGQRGSGDLEGWAVIPNFSFVYPFENGISIGFTSSATSGARTIYPWDWRGRYAAVDTDVAVMELQPSISYQINENLTIGAGFIIQYAQMTIDQALPCPMPGFLPAFDTRIHMEGDTFAYGYSVGLTWKPLKHTTVGLAYRSSMTYKMSMDVDYRSAAAVNANIYENAMGDGAHCNLRFPQVVNFGIVQELTDKWRVMADLAWTDWSVMKRMKMKFRTGQESVEEMDWHDSWRLALGTDYQINDKWRVSCGFAADEAAAKRYYHKTAKLPDCTRYWFSAGVAYQITDNVRIDFSWMHLLYNSERIQQDINVGGNSFGTLKGKIVGYSDLASLGLRYDF